MKDIAKHHLAVGPSTTGSAGGLHMEAVGEIVIGSGAKQNAKILAVKNLQLQNLINEIGCVKKRNLR